MNTLDWVERGIGWIGGLAAAITLAVIFWGIWQGLHKAAGQTAGRAPGLLRIPVFYLLAGVVYFGLSYLLWRPVPLALSPLVRILALILGAPLYFSGLGLVLWGRFALGRLYFVSSGLGAQLFAGHRLVTNGPYALVRHPMYLGILLTGLGGILIYRTWTMVFVALLFPGLMVRAWREEQALAAEFGSQWLDYCRRTRRFFPRLPLDRLNRGPNEI